MGSIQEEQETNLPPPSWGVVFLHPEQRSDQVPRQSRFAVWLPCAGGILSQGPRAESPRMGQAGSSFLAFSQITEHFS